MAVHFRLRGVKSSFPTQIDTFYATTKQNFPFLPARQPLNELSSGERN